MLPVIDWQDYASGKAPDAVAQQIGKAAREFGGFVLTGHGIPRGLLADVTQLARAFFAMETHHKDTCAASQDLLARGWRATLLAGGKGDLGEAFRLGPLVHGAPPADPFRAANLWPDVESFRDVMRDAYKDLEALAQGLIHALERDLDLSRDVLGTHFTRALSTLDLVRLPNGARCSDVTANEIAPASALSLSLIEPRTAMALYSRAGDWLRVPDAPAGLLVRIGECLVRWSNGQYHAAPVQVTQGSGGIVASFAAIPQETSVLAPLPRMGEPLYPPVTVADFLTQQPRAGRAAAAE